VFGARPRGGSFSCKYVFVLIGTVYVKKGVIFSGPYVFVDINTLYAKGGQALRTICSL
jgi:hypothetical protein